jgi:hypothetical protein
MTRVPIKAILATAASAALLGACATTIEAGPGYYRYDTGLAPPSAPAVVYREPAPVYREPAVVYREPGVAYREPAVVYRNPPIVYGEPTLLSVRADVLFNNDHGQLASA